MSALVSVSVSGSVFVSGSVLVSVTAYESVWGLVPGPGPASASTP